MILSGDHYHDKINHQIEGFFHCLDYLEIQYETSSEETIRVKLIKRILIRHQWEMNA